MTIASFLEVRFAPLVERPSAEVASETDLVADTWSTARGAARRAVPIGAALWFFGLVSGPCSPLVATIGLDLLAREFLRAGAADEAQARAMDPVAGLRRPLRTLVVLVWFLVLWVADLLLTSMVLHVLAVTATALAKDSLALAVCFSVATLLATAYVHLALFGRTLPAFFLAVDQNISPIAATRATWLATAAVWRSFLAIQIQVLFAPLMFAALVYAAGMGATLGLFSSDAPTESGFLPEVAGLLAISVVCAAGSIPLWLASWSVYATLYRALGLGSPTGVVQPLHAI